MKKIAVDLHKINNLNSGLGQFSLQFSHSLIRSCHSDLEIELLVPAGCTNVLPDSKHQKTTLQWWWRWLSYKKNNYAVWHSLNQFPSYLPPKNTKWILTIHDLNFLQEKSGNKRKQYLQTLQRNVERAQAITAISNFTKGEIEKHLELGDKKIHVIHNGVNPMTDIEPDIPSNVPQKPFFFSIGIFSKKKNFELLVEMMRFLPGFELVIAGNNNTPYGRFLSNKLTHLGLRERVHFPGTISQAQKKWYLANCVSFLFPSLAEGFGIPVIEAMNEGKPVFLSTKTSLPEIGGTTAFYFNDLSARPAATQLLNQLSNLPIDEEGFRNKIKQHAQKFRWQMVIEQYIELYRDLLQTTKQIGDAK